jgi:putative FmdB family regulatory protein
MPIYAYRCNECGHTQDILQKISDPLVTVCPSCGQAEFKKCVTAAGFQLKGSGWYVTDFKGSAKTAPADKAETKTESTENSTAAATPPMTSATESSAAA